MVVLHLVRNNHQQQAAECGLPDIAEPPERIG